MKKLLLSFGLLFSVTFLNAQVPANDTCASSQNITVVTASTNTYTADMMNATETAEGSCQNPSDVDPDVWYNFTMPVDGNVQISGISNNDYITLYESCGGTEVACFFNNGFIYGLTGGENYTLKFARFGAPDGVYDFTIQAFEAPNNDTCAMSEGITVSTAMANTYITNVAGATETEEGSCQNPADVDPDVWYNFTMPVDGNVQISNISNNDYITVYESCGGTEVACFFNNNFIYGLTGGEDYTLKFARFGVPASVNDFTIQAFAATANDTCAMSQNIAVETAMANTYTANIFGATETVEGSCQAANDVDPDAWFDFTMPINGNIEITGITNNDYITIYDACGGAEVACFFGNSSVLSLVGGQDYVLKFARYRAQGGTYDFTIQAFSALANDECSNPETISLVVGTETFVATDLQAATPSTTIPNPCGEDPARIFPDVWYQFTMPAAGGNLKINNNNGGTEVISIYNNCGDTVEVGCEFGNGYIYDLTGGANYFLRYAERDIFINTTSDFSLEVFTPLTNDECSNPETINLVVGTETLVATDLRAATASTDIPNPCGENAARIFQDLWYQFTMPAVGGNLKINNNNGGTEVISIYDNCGDIVEVGCEFGNGYIYDLTAGAVYLLRYAERDIHINTTSDFGLEVFAPLANDECSSPDPINLIVGTETFVTSDLRAATPSTTIPNPCGENAGRIFQDVWYQFTMPAAGGNLIINNNNGGTEVISFYDNCGDTIEVGCEFGNGYIYDLTAGAVYLLRYAERDIHINTSSDFSLEVFAPLANDECANPEMITVNEGSETLVSTDLRAATPSTTIPNPCGENAARIFQDVWYEFVMPVEGNLNILNNNGGTEVISLYDMCGDMVEVGCEFGNGLIYNLTEGNTYILRYAERDIHINTTSDFSLQAYETAPNDECENATTLNLSSVSPVLVTTELRGASNDSEISCENNVGRTYLDVWYDMTMPVDGEIQVNNVNNSMFIAFFDDCGGNEITCFFNDGSLFNVEAGTNLKMRASVRDISVGEYTFDVIVVPSPLPTCTDTTEFIGGAWNNGLPDNTKNVIFRDNYNTATTLDGGGLPYGSVEACSVSIDAGTTVTITANHYLDVSYSIINNGTIEVEHQASIVQRDDAAVATNNGTINVNVTTPVLDPRDFMIMGSPMTAETRTGVFVNAFRVLEHDTNNFVPDPTVATAFPLAENFADDNGDNWSAQMGLLNPAEGYLVQPQPNLQTGGAFDLTFETGTLNNGVVTIPLLFNTDKNSSPNIISNPYASALLADDFISLNPEIDEVYFWEHLTEPSPTLPGYNSANFSMEDISMYNLMGGVKAASDPSENDTKPNGLIATAQGFGVKATAAGTATFNNVMRRVDGNTTLRTPENVDRLWLNITNEQWNIHGSTLIGFSDNASEMLDPGYDSRRLATFLGMYSHLQDGSEELGIQSLGSFNSAMTIPLGFSSQLEQDDATYTISLNEVEGAAIENATVYLIDTVTGLTTNLSSESYSFNSSMGSYSNRFILQFEDESILNIDEVSASSFVVYPNPAKDSINITSVNDIQISEVHIYDLQGRALISEIFEVQNGVSKMDISSLSSAGYLMKIVTENGAVTKNIIKE